MTSCTCFVQIENGVDFHDNENENTPNSNLMNHQQQKQFVLKRIMADCSAAGTAVKDQTAFSGSEESMPVTQE